MSCSAKACTISTTLRDQSSAASDTVSGAGAAEPILKLRVDHATGAAPSGPHRKRFLPWALAIAVVALLLSLMAGIALGASDVSFADVADSIAARLGLNVGSSDSITDAIIWQMRAPRVLLAAIVGAGLAVCGAVLQALTRNALADPYLLGISSGASTGAVCVIVLGIGSGLFAVSVGAFVGSMLSFAIVLVLIGRRMGTPSRVVLSGVAISQLFSATTSLILMSSADSDSTQSVVSWMLGSLAGAQWPSIAVSALVFAVGGTICWLCSDILNAFVFGKDAAAALGVSPGKTSLGLFAITAMITAVLVAASGAIGFVGLIVPHLARLLGAIDHRVLLPTSALLGALFLVWADVVSRIAFAPQQIPVGVVTALIGVPVFAVILRGRKGRMP